MEKKISMDPSNVAMLCTTNEKIYQKERMKDEFFQNDNDPDMKGTGVTKEPQIPITSFGIYPLII